MFRLSKYSTAFLLIALVVAASAIGNNDDNAERNSRVKRQWGYGGYPYGGYYGGYGYPYYGGYGGYPYGGWGGYGGGWGWGHHRHWGKK